MIKVTGAEHLTEDIRLQKLTINDEYEFDVSDDTEDKPDLVMMFTLKDGQSGIIGGGDSDSLLLFIIMLIGIINKENILHGPVKSMASMLALALEVLLKTPSLGEKASEKPDLADLMRQEATNGQH